MWLWDTATWAPVGPPLEAHTLTVTQLAFSPGGDRLLSISRDRSLAVYERCADGPSPQQNVVILHPTLGRPMRTSSGAIFICLFYFRL